MERFESPSEGEQERFGKFATARDEVLYGISLAGWGNESSGDVEAPTGHFCKIVIAGDELAEIVEAFQEEIIAARLSDPHRLVGNWLMLEDDQGHVTVLQYRKLDQLNHDYQLLDEAYGAWLDANQ